MWDNMYVACTTLWRQTTASNLGKKSKIPKGEDRIMKGVEVNKKHKEHHNS